jgi:CDP-6-deoxy-D-xylo-4-hexulose-3-dehydrase
MQAAIGVAQIEKLDFFTKRRRENFERLKNALRPIEDKIILPESAEEANPSWFGFIMTCREGVSREKITSFLEKRNIQTRVLFAGNIILHPCFDEMRKTNTGYRVCGSLDNTNRIMKDTFWVGVYPGMTDEKIDYMAKSIIDALGEE